jgi:hypothetical protein
MENAQLHEIAESSAPDRTDSKRARRFTPRQSRVVEALRCTDGWIFREDIDRIAGASNGPEVIAQLRHGWGLVIDMERVDRTDRDGEACSPGRYRLTEQGRDRLQSIKRGRHV